MQRRNLKKKIHWRIWRTHRFEPNVWRMAKNFKNLQQTKVWDEGNDEPKQKFKDFWSRWRERKIRREETNDEDSKGRTVFLKIRMIWTKKFLKIRMLEEGRNYVSWRFNEDSKGVSYGRDERWRFEGTNSEMRLGTWRLGFEDYGSKWCEDFSKSPCVSKREFSRKSKRWLTQNGRDVIICRALNVIWWVIFWFWGESRIFNCGCKVLFNYRVFGDYWTNVFRNQACHLDRGI